jgi:3-oxoacyl-[acyl-carrier-protein] synthase-3
MTTSDLCFAAAEKLIGDLSWNKDEVDGLIFGFGDPDSGDAIIFRKK